MPAASMRGFLLVDALKRISRVGIPGLLDRSLSVLHENSGSRSAAACKPRQCARIGFGLLPHRRRKNRESVPLGTVCGRFCRWCSPRSVSASGKLRTESGVAFQVIDDVLDLAGNPEVVGKSLFADLHEGKMTYPLLLAIEREPSLGEELAAACEQAALCLSPDRKHLTAVLWEKGWSSSAFRSRGCVLQRRLPRSVRFGFACKGGAGTGCLGSGVPRKVEATDDCFTSERC